MDQGAGSAGSQPVTFPRLGRQPVLFKGEALHVPIDKPPWSLNPKGSDRFKCPARESRGLAYPWAGLAADLLPHQHIIAGQGALICEAVVCGSFCLCCWLPLRHDGLAHGRSDLALFL